MAKVNAEHCPRGVDSQVGVMGSTPGTGGGNNGFCCCFFGFLFLLLDLLFIWRAPLPPLLRLVRLDCLLLGSSISSVLVARSVGSLSLDKSPCGG
jgi:hypothetical protein